MLPERRDPCEQAEVDGEAVAARVPRVPPVGGHAEPHRIAVERDRERQRARTGRLGVAELERREAEEEERTRPDAEPLRILERCLPLLSELPPDPVDPVRKRSPRVEHGPHVSEQHLHRHEAEPEDHVDECRREVLRRRGLAEERRQEDEDEQPGRDRAEHPVQDRRPQKSLETCRQRFPGAPPLELRALPECPEREEREDEHDCAAPEEEPVGDRQVAHPADSVGEQRQGRTSRSAIGRPRSSSSISKRPGALAVKSIVPGAPGATSTIRS